MLFRSISVLVGTVMISLLRRMKAGQTVREEGPKSHLKKHGTPTMGVLIIIIALTITSLFYMKSYPKIMPVLFLTLGFGLIGCIDDFIKVVLKRSLGLKIWQKLILQFIVTGIFAYYMTQIGTSFAMKIPFSPDKYIDFGIWNIPILFFIVIGTVNGTNFTDGLEIGRAHV